MLNNIVIIALGYPTETDPDYAFIQPIARRFADSGIHCTIIAPLSITEHFLARRKLKPYKSQDITEQNNTIDVFRPRYLSLSNYKVKGTRISSVLFDKAVQHCVLKEKLHPDVYYAHFWQCGISAAKIARDINTPVIVVSGESAIQINDYYPHQEMKQLLKYINGVIFVSKKNKEESENLNLITEQTKTCILPNGYDPKSFYHISKEEARQAIGVDKEKIIGIFVGLFCERKGPERVIMALKQMPDVNMMMIGKGTISEDKHIIKKGPVPHNELNMYLNAADFFVLPTRAEGCCNAIVEALACGLPVISSNLPFNNDILDDTNSIRIDPDSIHQISEAIQSIKDSPELRSRLSQGALKRAESLTIQSRTDKILSFIKNTIQCSIDNCKGVG